MVDLNNLYKFVIDFPQWKLARTYENEILITNNYPNQGQTLFNPDNAILGNGFEDPSLVPTIRPNVFLPIRLESFKNSNYVNGILTIENTNGYLYILNGILNSVDVFEPSL